MLTVSRLIEELNRATKLNPAFGDAVLVWDGTTAIEGGIAAERDGKPILILAPQKLDKLPGGF